MILNSDILLFDDLIGLLNRILGMERKTKDFDFLPIIEVINLKRVLRLFYNAIYSPHYIFIYNIRVYSSCLNAAMA